MNRFFQRLFGTKTQPIRSTRRRSTMRPSLEALEDRLVPSTLNVTSPYDPSPAAAKINGLTLRAAITQANAAAAGGTSDTIVFDKSLNGDTITLTQGALELKDGVHGAGAIIDGGHKVTISGGHNSNVFVVDANAGVDLENLVITAGKAANGGAILNNGTLAVSNSVLSSSNATNGGAIYNTGNLAVSNCTLEFNKAAQQGGAIYNTGSVYLFHSSVFENTAATFGGAIMNWGYLAAEAGTAFAGNSASSGGGAIYNEGQTYLSDCLFSSNSGSNGGAIENSGNLHVVSTTFENNSATSAGGAIFNWHGAPISLSDITFLGNKAPSGPNVYQN
jgi:predicted outer membrane repeat protein